VGRGENRGSGQGRDTGRGTGRMGGAKAAGPGGQCVCPKCGHQVAHTRGRPCYKVTCPKCKTSMTRD